MTTKVSLNIYKISPQNRALYSSEIVKLCEIHNYLFLLLSLEVKRRQVSLARYLVDISDNWYFKYNSNIESTSLDFDLVLKKSTRMASVIQFIPSSDEVLLACEWMGEDGEVLGSLILYIKEARMRMRFTRGKFSKLPIGS